MTLLGHSHLFPYLKERSAKRSVSCLKVGAVAIEMVEEDKYCLLSSCNFHSLISLQHTAESASVHVKKDEIDPKFSS